MSIFKLTVNNKNLKFINIDDHEKFFIVKFERCDLSDNDDFVLMVDDIYRFDFTLYKIKYKIKTTNVQNHIRLDHIVTDNYINCFFIKN